MLKKRLHELEDSEVVVLGDLNENYNEYQLVHKSYNTALMYNNQGDGITITDGTISSSSELYTVWPGSKYPGSYKYHDSWETIDHFLLNSKLMDSSGFSFADFIVDSRQILINNNDGVNRWITDLETGYSDHLPVILHLAVQQSQTSLE